MPSAAGAIPRERTRRQCHLPSEGPARSSWSSVVTGCTGAPGSAIARSAPESFSPLVKRVLPSVVNIAVTETVSGGEVLSELPPELRDTPLGREFRTPLRQSP